MALISGKDRLRSALRRRDLFVAPSIRYADARIGLLSGSAWEGARSTVCRSLGHSLSAEETITALSRQLDQTYRAVAANLPNNPAARIENVGGQDELVLAGAFTPGGVRDLACSGPLLIVAFCAAVD